MAEDTPTYNVAAVRALLLAAFTANDLRRIFLYTSNQRLQSLQQQFSPVDGLEVMVDKVITYCHPRNLLPDLLQEVKAANPRQYARYESRLQIFAPEPVNPGHQADSSLPAAGHGADAPEKTPDKSPLPDWLGKVAAIAAILALVVAILALARDYFDWKKPAPTITPEAQLLAPSPSPEPTATAAQETPSSQDGWIVYDDFDDPGTLDSNWSMYGQAELCQLSIAEGQLRFDCLNETADDLGAALNAAHHIPETLGVAATVSVEKIGGPLQLVTSWVCGAQGVTRDYHLELDVDAARAKEFYPQEEKPETLLGEQAVAAGQAHLLQMERTGGSLTFSVDGQPLALDVVPDLPDCYVMNYWSFDFWVWQDGNRLAGQVDQVWVKTE